MQNYFLPAISYYQLFNTADKFIFLNDVNYINKGWINRNRILIDRGKREYKFTIPLSKASQNKKINEIKLSSEYPEWKKKFLGTLKHYNDKPYFNDIYPLLEEILESEETIDLLAMKSIKKVAEYLNLTKETFLSSEYDNKELKGQNRIIDLCLKNKATTYINPIGGVELYDKNTFSQNGLELFFLKCSDNLSKLSIIDTLMNYSKPEIIKMLGEFELQ